MRKAIIILIGLLYCTVAKAQWYNKFTLSFDTSQALVEYYRGSSFYEWIGTDSLISIDSTNFPRNRWEIGKPNKLYFDSAYSYPNAIVTDTLNPCLSNDTSVFILKFPFYNWHGNFSFVYKLSIDTGDIANVYLSFDGQKSWLNLLTDTSGLFFVDTPKASFSTSTLGWDSISTQLGYSATLNWLYVKFSFATGNDTGYRAGWMIDNIKFWCPVEGIPSIGKSNFNIYPNPANGNVKLGMAQPLATNCKMMVIDALGRQVFQHVLTKGSTEYTLHVKDWMKGVYFIELDDGRGGRAVRKLMVE